MKKIIANGIGKLILKLVRKKVSKIYKIDDSKFTFSVRGNHTDSKGKYIPIEVLYNAYREQIGKEIKFNFEGTVLNNYKGIISNVSIQGDFVFIEVVKSN
jgi:hypothetical protein